MEPIQNPYGPTAQLGLLGARAESTFSADLAARGLNPDHLRVLQTISDQPAQSQSAVAARLGLAQNRVVTLVNDLEADELVERRHSRFDRRMYELYPGPRARALITELHALAEAHDAELVAALTPDEVSTLLDLLGRVV